MDFPSEILDLREVRRYESLELRACREYCITLVIDTEFCEKNVDYLKTALLHHSIIPRKAFPIGKGTYKFRGKHKNIDYELSIFYLTEGGRVKLDMRVGYDDQEAAKKFFELIETYMQLTKPVSSIN